MDTSRILNLASDLIALPSLSGQEREVLLFVEKLCIDNGWPVERLADDGQTFECLHRLW